MVLDDFKDDFRKAFGDGLAHSGTGLRVDRTESEGPFTSLSCRPLRIRVPNTVGASMQTRAKSAVLCPQELRDARPRSNKGLLFTGAQPPPVKHDERRGSCIHDAKVYAPCESRQGVVPFSGTYRLT